MIRFTRLTTGIQVLLCAAIFPNLALNAAGVPQASEPVTVSYTIDPGQVVNRIDEKIYGHFFEHIYHSANGGLWGELVWNRSFEENSGGRWQVADGVVAQAGMGTDQRLMFGDPSWTDYEMTLEAQKTGGSEGFLILFRETNPASHYWYNLGGWGNVRHQLEKATAGRSREAVGPVTRGRIETGRWYRIRVRCEGKHIKIWLDEKQVLDYVDERSANLKGRVGIGTWATTAEFRGMEVTSLDGTVLYEGTPPAMKQTFKAKHWRVSGQGTAEVVTEDPLNSHACVRIQGRRGRTSLVQDEKDLRAGETYVGSLWARGTARQGLAVRLIKGETTLAEQTFSAPGRSWREMKFALTPQISDANAALQIEVRGRADVVIDQVSMMPKSWQAQGGFRPDLLGAIADIQAPIIRWPGGCFASPYRWKDGIGPQHKRVVTRRELWDDLDINSHGTDEFIALCQRVETEPIIVVNIGTPQWNVDADTYDFLQDALDWMEYCNGPADSKWGKVRAANGHPAPYHVKYWEIDNETWGMGVEDYIKAIKRFAPAMRRAYPSVKLIACGSGGFDQGWNRRVIEACSELIDYLSIHHYENPDRYAQGPYAYERFIREAGDIIATSKNPDLKIYCSEWNAQTTDWRTGLYAGGVLNGFERCGDVFEIGGPALFLRHVSASDWDNAFINFDQSSWFAAPNYVVMQLWRRHYAPSRVALEGDIEALNTIATKSADGRTVYVKCVNPGQTPAHVTLRLAPGHVPVTAGLEWVAPGSLAARNTLERPHAVRAESAFVRIENDQIQCTLPAWSSGVVTIGLD